MRDQLLRDGVYARAFGAGEMILSSMFGRYPPPHDLLDVKQQEMEDAHVRPRLPKLLQTDTPQQPKQMELLLV